MGSHGAVGNGGGGKEKGKPGIDDPGAADAVVSVVDEVGWLVPDGNKHHIVTTCVDLKMKRKGINEITILKSYLSQPK